MIKRIICFVLILSALYAAAAVSVCADDEMPQFASQKVAAMNIETGQFVVNTAQDERLQPGVTAKMMTAIVAYENIKNLAATVKAPDEVKNPKYIGYGGISAPTLGISAGSEYPVRAYLQALLAAEANDAAITLAYYVTDGDISKFVDMMNEKAAELGAVDTHYTNCTGLVEDGTYTTLRDTAIIAAELYGIKDLADMAGTGVVNNEMGRFHNKNYLTSDYLVRNYTMAGVNGLCAGQYTETSGYSLVAATESNGLSYVFVFMEAEPEQREVSTGKRWFADGNAYEDMKKLVPWATNGFKYEKILSRENYIREIPVKFSVKADYVMVVPENDVECLLPKSIDPDRDLQKVETWDVDSLNAPVEKGQKVGSITIMQNGIEIAKIRLVTDSALEESTLLTLGHKLSLFLKNKYTRTAIRVLIMILIVYAAVSFAMFIYRIVRKYVRGAKENDESMTDDERDKFVK